ncbi:hypothetical protein BCU93_05815 [Vibrio breoganii]|uniref:DUF2971 domain-containing protein n=1 Tax=Vibrio breoganii TaxID=553239 RepID=UPI000C84FC50|nr:DUF2971 domain-containing protein [Vibrio breoganii]PMG32481.1 hypothetical protein BCU93_05815 [Vibrio breoganii]PMJ49518.1 hypothetical protein BCU21_03260 [Vibrio breoganii]PMK55644.1 hypothetical protein BCT97_13485 [Vibrio breoganii]PMK57588.1 hypothetical protein BCT98_08575 [Vibrio breoganii]PMM81513.1 hypothetical protein BCT44_13015 [Vibrio breoganii]
MLVKYLGTVWNEDIEQCIPRATFLDDGLFRFTQPNLLNDKGSEAKFEAIFDGYSRADISWAKKRYLSQSTDLECPFSEEQLISFFLEPTGVRYGDDMPWIVKEQTSFETMAEYDYDIFEKSVLAMNHKVIDLLSTQIGVFSLSKSDNSVYMWTHYASEGKGIAVVFKETHPFFKQYPVKDVSYNPEDRATISFRKGLFRINGNPVENIQEVETQSGTQVHFLTKDIDWEDLTTRLIYSKHADPWCAEEEKRIVLPFEHCEVCRNSQQTADTDTPVLKDIIHSNVYLKKIPLDAIDAIIFGFGTQIEHKQAIIEKLSSTKELAHIKKKVVKYNVFNRLEVVDI